MPSEFTQAQEFDVVVIGAGLSGSLVAANLLRRAVPGLKITLIERKPPFGRGVAYGTLSPVHRLNVPAGKLSAWPEDPDDFFNWASHQPSQPGLDEPVTKTDFLPRYLFGQYIEATLQSAKSACEERWRAQSSNPFPTNSNALPSPIFKMAAGEVVDIEENTEGGAHTVLLADGTTLPAHRVVLALGNLPGEYPIRKSLPIYRSWRYVHVPWLMAAVENVKPNEDVLIVGAGLTAVDIILQLDAQGHRGTIHALSRRGLQPQKHRLGPAYSSFITAADLPLTLREVTRRVRAEVKKAKAQGIDWRGVVDALRPVTQALWRGFSKDDRARFMRHVRPFWETHRHRLAPQVGARIEEIERDGHVQFYAGRLQTLEDVNGSVHATFRRRGTNELVDLHVGKVINCTGPRTDYSKFQHPLFINLLARGLITHDPLAIGLNTAENGEVYKYGGDSVGWLYTLGAPMKGTLWECTAVPEIRGQAAKLAEKLAAEAGAFLKK